MSNIQTLKRVYAPAGHVNLSCCRLCKSVGNNISHSKNLFAKNNRALLASVEELYGGSLSHNELLHVATFGMKDYVDHVKGESTTLKLSRT